MTNAQCPDSARGAIELMTAWLAKPDGPPDVMIDNLSRQLDRHPDRDNLVAAVELIMGLTYLCGSLMGLREHETGIATQKTVQDLALEYARTRPGRGACCSPGGDIARYRGRCVHALVRPVS
jgi:hypothetical protein